MKNYICMLIFCTTISVSAQLSKSPPSIDTTPVISDVAIESSDEEKTRQFVKNYIAQINKKNWSAGIEEYLPDSQEAFIKEHTAFRASFPNYKATIKRMFVEGNEVILWLNITANYVADFRYEKSEYQDQLLRNYKAKNQALNWDETWYFDVVAGKFGDKWDMLKDNYAVLKGLDVKEK